jgi:NAD(P)-dependent dehydrogenase (short-subunit alcohol dehydrogenase family)
MAGRVVVVTGANRGLGLGVARALARRGERVVLTARDLEKARAAAAALAAEGLEVVPEALDVASTQSVEVFFARLDVRYGGLDVLINNAGAFVERGISDTLSVPADLVLEGINNNAVSAVRMMQGAIPRMQGAGRGWIVNVSSGLGALTEMGGGYPAYRLSKAALNAATRVYAHEAGPGIKVNAVCPGWVKTDMGGESAPRALEQGVASIVWGADLGADGPTGGFFRDGAPLDW